MMVNSESNKQEFKIISNDPCGKDLFEGKSHENIAKQISHVIENDVECKLIGIEGGWGSGKSNLIEIIESEINKELDDGTPKPIKYHFFTYDTWGHQEDIQRKAILEELTEEFIKVVQTPKLEEKWRLNLKMLLAKKKETETKSIPKLSYGVIVSILALLLIPILDPVKIIIEALWWEILISAIPLLLIGSVLVYHIHDIIKNGKKQDKGICNILTLALSRLYMLYKTDKIDITLTEIVSETIPSSREFRKWIKDMSDDLENVMLIIVFDNMDRLPKDKVQELWSSINIFFAEGIKDANTNIKVIIPFDRLHIRCAFQNNDLLHHSMKLETSRTFGDDFINKTFDIVYRVPPIIMTDWKKYFRAKWNEAFKVSISEDENYNKVTQIFDLLSENQSPREIIAFINEIVTIKQTLTDEIPDEYIALFFFGKDKIAHKPSKEIFNPSFLGEALRPLYANDEKLPEYIASLFYQLPPDKVIKFIFTDELRKALDRGYIQKVQEISVAEEFFDLLENIVSDITNLPNWVITLDEVLKGSKDLKKVQCIWNDLYRQVKNKETSLKEYQLILIKHIQMKEEYLKTILNDFTNSELFNAITYFNDINKLAELDGINVFTYLNLINVDGITFSKILALAKLDYQKYKIICKESEFDKYLAEVELDSLNNLRIVPYIKTEYNLPKYTESLYGYQSDVNLSIDQARIVNDRLKEIDRPLKKMLSDTQIYNYFRATSSDDPFYYDLLCMRFAKLNQFNQSYLPPFNTLNDTDNSDIIENIAKNIEYYIGYGNILMSLDEMKYPLFKGVAKQLTIHPLGQSTLNVVIILNNFDRIIKNSDITPSELLDRLNEWNYTVKKRMAQKFFESKPLSLVKACATSSNDLSTTILEKLREYHKQLTVEHWADSIIHIGFDYEAFRIVKEEIPQNLFDAFKQILMDIVLNSDLLMNIEQVKYLVQRITSEGKDLSVAFKDVRDSFCSGRCRMTEDLFINFGDWLLTYADLPEKKDSLRTIFPSTILDNKDCIAIIMKHRVKMASIVNNAEKESKDFKDKIEEIIKRTQDVELIDFAKTIGIEFEVETKEDLDKD
jgi:hypothetical protein